MFLIVCDPPQLLRKRIRHGCVEDEAGRKQIQPSWQRCKTVSLCRSPSSVTRNCLPLFAAFVSFAFPRVTWVCTFILCFLPLYFMRHLSMFSGSSIPFYVIVQLQITISFIIALWTCYYVFRLEILEAKIIICTFQRCSINPTWQNVFKKIMF